MPAPLWVIMQHLQSKTIAGLLVILLVACGMAFANKLTPQLVDVLKWVGSSFMAVRAVANYGVPSGS